MHNSETCQPSPCGESGFDSSVEESFDELARASAHQAPCSHSFSGRESGYKSVDVDVDISEEDNEIRGEIALWRAVIMQAVVDAANKSKRTENVLAKFAAIKWFDLSNTDFVHVCANASLDSRYVCSKAKAAIARDCQWMKKKGVNSLKGDIKEMVLKGAKATRPAVAKKHPSYILGVTNTASFAHKDSRDAKKSAPTKNSAPAKNIRAVEKGTSVSKSALSSNKGEVVERSAPANKNTLSKSSAMVTEKSTPIKKVEVVNKNTVTKKCTLSKNNKSSKNTAVTIENTRAKGSVSVKKCIFAKALVAINKSVTTKARVVANKNTPSKSTVMTAKNAIANKSASTPTNKNTTPPANKNTPVNAAKHNKLNNSRTSEVTLSMKNNFNKTNP